MSDAASRPARRKEGVMAGIVMAGIGDSLI
jgi:hypothetical protein